MLWGEIASGQAALRGLVACGAKSICKSGNKVALRWCL